MQAFVSTRGGGLGGLPEGWCAWHSEGTSGEYGFQNAADAKIGTNLETRHVHEDSPPARFGTPRCTTQKVETKWERWKVMADGCLAGTIAGMMTFGTVRAVVAMGWHMVSYGLIKSCA